MRMVSRSALWSTKDVSDCLNKFLTSPQSGRALLAMRQMCAYCRICGCGTETMHSIKLKHVVCDTAVANPGELQSATNIARQAPFPSVLLKRITAKPQ
jgi:hypothetical protein